MNTIRLIAIALPVMMLMACGGGGGGGSAVAVTPTTGTPDPNMAGGTNPPTNTPDPNMAGGTNPPTNTPDPNMAGGTNPPTNTPDPNTPPVNRMEEVTHFYRDYHHGYHDLFGTPMHSATRIGAGFNVPDQRTCSFTEDCSNNDDVSGELNRLEGYIDQTWTQDHGVSHASLKTVNGVTSTHDMIGYTAIPDNNARQRYVRWGSWNNEDLDFGMVGRITFDEVRVDKPLTAEYYAYFTGTGNTTNPIIPQSGSLTYEGVAIATARSKTGNRGFGYPRTGDVLITVKDPSNPKLDLMFTFTAPTSGQLPINIPKIGDVPIEEGRFTLGKNNSELKGEGSFFGNEHNDIAGAFHYKKEYANPADGTVDGYLYPETELIGAFGAKKK